MLLALKDARRAKTCRAITEMETEIDETDDLIRILFIRVQPDENGNRPHVIQNESGGYFWGGRDLAPNLVIPVRGGSSCPECGARFWRTKRAVNCGAGVRNVIISCHCKTVFADADYVRRLKGKPGQRPRSG